MIAVGDRVLAYTSTFGGVGTVVKRSGQHWGVVLDDPPYEYQRGVTAWFWDEEVTPANAPSEAQDA